MITQLAKFTDVRVALVVGGLSLSVQAATLRTSPEVVVATPVSHGPASWGITSRGILGREDNIL